MKFKVGDRVRVRKDLEYDNFYGGVRVNDEMVNNKGKVLTIIGIDNRTYLVEGSTWFWTDEMFENKVDYTYEDLRKSPVGTKITFENGRTFVRASKDNRNDEFTDLDEYRDISDLKNLKDNWAEGTYGKIIKIEEPMYTTVYEYKPEILDEVEKRYLKNVIRPFRDSVKSIEKFIFSTGNAKIIIKIERSESFWDISLPPFEKYKMYKNMEEDKEYTLEELGL